MAENPKPYQCILDLGEREKYDLCHRLDIFRLFPLDSSDFTKACSCRECCSKISQLVDFEADIIYRNKLIREVIHDFNKDHTTWSDLESAIHWTKQMSYLLHKKLKAAAAAAEDHADDDAEQMECVYDENDDLLDAIETVSSDLDRRLPILNDKVAPVIQNMIIKEKAYQDAQNKCADSSTLNKLHIQQQIQLANTIPLHDMELISKDTEDKMNQCKSNDLVQAKEFILYTILDVVHTRKSFWENRLHILAQEHSSDHKSNEVDQTLNSLINKAETFKNAWQKKFSDLFTYDRSDPKRQRKE